MNTQLIDSLVQAIQALTSEERSLFEQKLNPPKNWQTTLQQIQADADAIYAERGGAPFDIPPEDWVRIAREERIMTQDLMMKDQFPDYVPPPIR